MKRDGSGVPSAGSRQIWIANTPPTLMTAPKMCMVSDGGHEQIPVLETSGKMVMQNS